MKPSSPPEVCVIGSGPNGLTAAILIARAGLKTTVFEAQPTIGGGTRSAALTLPGFVHDVCSAVHPMAVSSPVFASFPLDQHGLEWIQPPSPLAHPLDDGSAVLVDRSVSTTAERLGIDGPAYRRLAGPLVQRWKRLMPEVLGPIVHVPHDVPVLARFGLFAPWPAARAAYSLFRNPRTRAMFGGMAAHSILPFEMPGSGAFGWMIGLSAHAAGWPIPRGGSQKIADALASYFESLGGRIIPNSPVRSLEDVRGFGIVICDITPRQLLSIAGDQLPELYRRRLERYRYGPGVFKVDWALDAPIPWRSSDCLQSATVHIGGSFDDIAASERAPWNGETSERPFMILAQPSLFDPTRAPAGKHTVWAYCHVPNGSREDMTDRIERQIERFAPGFRTHILARHTMDTAYLQEHNANLVGGDINGGAADPLQMIFRPTLDPYRIPIKGWYLCSSSTPPTGGVHGMSGYHAAQRALRDAGM